MRYMSRHWLITGTLRRNIIVTTLRNVLRYLLPYMTLKLGIQLEEAWLHWYEEVKETIEGQETKEPGSRKAELIEHNTSNVNLDICSRSRTS